MNISEIRAKILYPIYKFAKKMTGSPLHLPIDCNYSEGGLLIKNTICKNKPAMIARFGATEIRAIEAYINLTKLKNPISKLFHKLKLEHINFDEKIINMMNAYSGFFPSTPENLVKFSQLTLEDTKQLDILGVWRPEEFHIKSHLKNAKKIPLAAISPVLSPQPWSVALEGKKVLVIHPFAETILKQYGLRDKLFPNSNVLPEFDLKCIKAVQSIASEKVPFKTWFEALDCMKNQISSTDFDIALIGAGAYGFSLAAHIKRIGKIAVHIGGDLQILFGIFGNRWEMFPEYKELRNECWTRPSKKETPNNSTCVENSTYW